MARLLRAQEEYRVTGEFGIVLRGSAEFITRTEKALALLRGSAVFEEVRPFLAVIQQAKWSGVSAYRCKPMFFVGKPTWQADSLWYASGIVHEAYHMKLYHENRNKSGFLCFRYTEPTAWAGKQAEQKCCEFQLRFLREAGADVGILEYVERLARNPWHMDVKDRNW